MFDGELRYMTFVDTLTRAIAEEVPVGAIGLVESNKRWVECAAGVARIADTLFPDDVEGRRNFLGHVLGIEADYLG